MDNVKESISNIELPYVEIPWEMLQKNKEVPVEEKLLTVTELELIGKNEVESINHITQQAEKLNELMTNTQLYTNAIQDRSVLYEQVGHIFNTSGSNDLAETLFNLLEDVYSKDYTSVDSISLVSVGRKQKNEKETQVLKFELNSVDDEMDYLKSTIDITMGTDSNVQDVKVSSKTKREGSTTRSMTTDAFVDEDTHNSFLIAFNEYANEFRNPLLYEKLMKKESKADKQLSGYLEGMATEKTSVETLKELFNRTRGDLVNGKITGFIMKDKNAEPITIYEFSVPSTKDIAIYEFHYDRSEKTIESITKK